MAKRHEEGHQVGGLLLRNGRWTVKVKVKGRQIWQVARSKEEAQLLLGRIRERAARGRIGLPNVATDTLADFAPVYLKWAEAHKRSADRDARSLKPLLAALGHVLLAELTVARLEEYKADRFKTESVSSVRAREAFERAHKDDPPVKGKRGKAEARKPPPLPPAPRTLAGATVNRELALLKGLLSHAVKIGTIEQNPLKGLSMYPETTGRLPSIDQAQEARLIATLPPWMARVYRLACLTGMRQGELLALVWRNCDLEGGKEGRPFAIVEDSKTREARKVYLHPAALVELTTMRDEAAKRLRKTADEVTVRRDLPDAPVLTMDDGTPPKGHSVSQAFRRAVRTIGRPDLRFHDTRHFYATRMIATGASLVEVASQTGHRSMTSLKRYGHETPERVVNHLAAMPTPGAAADDQVKTPEKEAPAKTARLRKTPTPITEARR